MMLSKKASKLQKTIRRVFLDNSFYVYERITGILEIRRSGTAVGLLGDVIIKRYPKFYSIDRIMHELWQRDTARLKKGEEIDDEKRLNKIDPSSHKMAKKLNYEAAKQEGKKPDAIRGY